MAYVSGAGVEAAAPALDGPDQAGAIFQRMETALAGKAQGPGSLGHRHRRTVGPFDFDLEPPAGVMFGFEVALVVGLDGDEVAVHASKVGFDSFLGANRLDPVDRRHLAFVIQPRLLLAAGADQLRIEIVDLAGEVGSRPRRHAAANPATVDD